MIKRKLAYLGLLAVFWFIMRLYLFRQTAVLFYMLLCFLPLLFVLFRIGARKTAVLLEIPKQVVKKGEMFCLRLTVLGKNSLPNGPVVVWLYHRNCITQKWKRKKLILPSGKEESYELYADSKYCSQFAFSVRRARVYDVFQIFSKRVRLLEDASLQRGVTVLPESFQIADWPVRPNPNVMVESDVYSNTKGGDDVSEIFDIRDYVPGDRLNRIHWKLTSKMDRLMVKELGLPIDCSVLIFLELGRYDDVPEFLKYRDAVFCALLSLAECLSAQGQIYYIAWNGADGLEEKHRITCAEEIYETIGLLLCEPAAGQKEDVGAACLFGETSEQYTNIFYLLASKRPGEGMRAMAERKNAAWLTILLFDGHEEARAAEREFLPDIDIVYLNPEHAKQEMETAFCREGSLQWQEN